MPKSTIAIAGAGLGGLVFALALQKYAPDVDFQLYEAAGELTTAGAGISIQPRTWYVLRELGLEEALLKVAGNGERPNLALLHRKSDQRVGFTFGETDPTESNFTFHRGDLQKVFIDGILKPERVHLHKRVESYTQPTESSEQITVHFQDGTAAKCDLLVGADGIKSRVRGIMCKHLADSAEAVGRGDDATFLRSCADAIFSGTVAYRGLVKRDLDALAEPHPVNVDHIVLYCGKNRHLVAYPITQGRVLNLAAIVMYPGQEGTIYEGPWTADVSKEEVLQNYIGWEPEVEHAMKAVSSWSKWAINVVKPLPTFVDGRVALVADAAHGMTPYQGAGAGQGFEDAWMLARLLGDSDVDQTAISTVLKVYDLMRRPITQDIAERSWRSGQLHSLHTPELEAITPDMSASGKFVTRSQLQMVAEASDRLMDWRKGTTIADDLQMALEKLRAELATRPSSLSAL
ncbi:FAD/NAD-P-binding domain-containing protein [Trametes meyenii]|nr:FAD/NAD-P-binding domain-containing protein [Trametes meyenii]